MSVRESYVGQFGEEQAAALEAAANSHANRRYKRLRIVRWLARFDPWQTIVTTESGERGEWWEDAWRKS